MAETEIPLRPVHLTLWEATVDKVAPLTAKINAEVAKTVRAVALDLGVAEADLPRVQLDAKRNVLVVHDVPVGPLSLEA